jgi:hypothetical protein
MQTFDNGLAIVCVIFQHLLFTRQNPAWRVNSVKKAGIRAASASGKGK